MNNILARRRARAAQRGSVSVVVALSLIALLAFTAIAVDVGYLMFSQRRLQAATDAAALAGATDLWTQSWATASSDAQSYAAGQTSSTSNTLPGNVTVTSTSIQGLKLASVTLPYAQAVSGYNGIQVTQQASVPTFFARAIGIKSATVSATSKAGAGGGTQAAQYNVMIILDTTASMNSTDSNCKNAKGVAQTRETCAKAGALQLLTGLTNAGDNVGLMVFPPMTSTYNFSCSKTQPGTAGSYSAIPSGASSTLGAYQISSPASGYLTSGGAANTSSGLVQALGGGSCSGLAANGGLGTFYGDAITQAQSALSTLSASQSPPGQNVIVLLSDGDASSSTKQLGSTFSSTYNQECQTAINDSAAAKNAGTLVYTVAYIGGESASATCSDGSDSLSPCATMASIATGSAYFFSDTCSNAAGGTASLNSIFKQITYTLTKPRLIPGSAA
jgi:Flp pilus assembly protein TadG